MSFESTLVADVLSALTGQESDNTTEQQSLGSTMKQSQLNLDTIERQKEYVAEQKAKGGSGTVIFQDAFIRGMRDLGYKDPAWALAELIDNSVQAGANTVDIRFAFDEKNASQAKNPSQIALLDDGNGMLPEMISYAVRWGGTDRQDDRNGFGRFGYGLPSSCVSLACKYTVYSKVAGGEWNSVSVDINKLAEASSDAKKTEALLQPKPASLPKWLLVQKDALDVQEMSSGTVIVLEDLDRLRGKQNWIQRKALRQRLLHQFGTIYRHWIPEVRIYVDGKECEAVDPLFLLPHARLVDETEVKAKKVVQRAFDYVTPTGVTGTVRIRAAYLHPQFSWATPNDLTSGTRKNERWDSVLSPGKGNNGILVCREGRQIDVVQPSWTKFQNNDAYVKIEIDFDPTLDEYFSITTSKQQINIDEDMMNRLKDSGKNAGGLAALVQEIRREWKEESKRLDAKIENLVTQTAKPLPAATAMAEAERFKTRTPRPSQAAKDEAEGNLRKEVEKRVRETGKTEEQVKEDLKYEIKTRPWNIVFQAMEEGPFYRPTRLGEQKQIILNTAHPFYSRLYEKVGNEATHALQVLLFVLADGEIDADGERATFYKSERNKWSEMLDHALSRLVLEAAIDDEESMEAERQEMERTNRAS